MCLSRYAFFNLKILIFLFLTMESTSAQITSCQAYTCDSLAIRAILDSNGLSNKSVEDVSQSSNGRIESLTLSNSVFSPTFINPLTSLPAEIGKLTALTDLRLGNNKLTSLPPEIGNLTKLKGLSLGGNQLTSLPTEVGKLTTLTSLNLNSNQLTSLPTEIGNITALITLSLSNNQLTSLPTEWGVMYGYIIITLY